MSMRTCVHGMSVSLECDRCESLDALESQLAAAKAEIETLKEHLQLANTDNFETEGRCFEWEQRNKRLREALEKIKCQPRCNQNGFQHEECAIAQAALDGGKA